MKREIFLRSLGLTALFGALHTKTSFASDIKASDCALKPGEIQHMVAFNLSYESNSPDAQKFIQDGTRILTGIPVVMNFQALRQVSKKNNYQYGFSMIFASQADYNTYNNHPDHVAFVNKRWKKEVTDFQEIDFQKYV